jgi:hypothetical protein
MPIRKSPEPILIDSMDEVDKDVLARSNRETQCTIELDDETPIRVYPDIVLKKRPDGTTKITVGMRKDDGFLYWIERRPREQQERMKETFGCPEGFSCLEEYIIKVADPNREWTLAPELIKLDEEYLLAAPSGNALLSTEFRSGKISPDKHMDIFKRALKGLSVLHKKNIVHNDVNWNNIAMVDGKPRWIDFEDSSYSANREWTLDASTFRMEDPPELYTQLLANPNTEVLKTDPSQDVYRAFFMAYIMITGTVPFNMQSIGYGEGAPTFETAREVWHKQKKERSLDLSRLPQELRVVFRKGLAADPVERYENSVSALKALDRATVYS